MLPGKTYSIEEIFRVLLKRAWLILVPLALASAITAVIVRRIPDSYRSTTTILVVPQRVPENFVRPTVTTRLEDRLAAISQEILSRPNLEQIIEDFNLYPEARRTGILADVVDRMRRQIRTAPLRDAFQVSFVGEHPRTVQLVTARLGTLFIEGNLRDREVLAEGTNQFLETQVEDARRRLKESESRLQAYNERFRGQLPSQLTANLQGVQATMGQLQSVVEAISRDRQQKLIQEQALADLENSPSPDPVSVGPIVDGSGNPAGSSAAQQLSNARAQMATYRQRGLTDKHPDVAKYLGIIRDLEAKVEAEALTRPVAEAGVSPAEAQRRKRIGELRSTIDQLDKQIATNMGNEKRLRDAYANYQARIEAVPARESELIDLTRDYDTIEQSYKALLRKKEDAQLAANLERRQIGEQFKLLDPATMPQKPDSPNRPLLLMVGSVLGLVIGVGLIVVLEYRDASLRTDEDVTQVLNLPVLAVVPLMQSDVEKRRHRRRQLLFGAGCASAVAACLAVVAYTLVR
jgi:polysaccharide chain length determinant protein (PEP-CTERM system associated)